MRRAAFAVISPHRDDAALSLGGFLGAMARGRVPFRIVNCFTISAWAPYREGLSTGEITRLRRREDRAFGRRLRYAPLWCDLRGVDAPLRLGEAVAILGCTEDAVRRDDVDWLARRLGATAGAELLLAPLALGRHVDHLVARRAAAVLRDAHALAFYEEIPYAGTTLGGDAAPSVAEAEAEAGRALQPISIAGTLAEKEALARTYRSQVGSEELGEIRLAVARLGGERLWADARAAERLRSWLGRGVA